MALLWFSIIYIEYPESFRNILEPESRRIRCHTTRPCIRKCCPHGEELQQPNPNLTSACYPTNLSHFFISDIPQENNGSSWNNDKFHIVYENCGKYNPEKYGDAVLLLQNGSVKINKKYVYDPSDYCIDFKHDKTYVYICTDKEEDNISQSLVFGYIFSACSLLLTTVVYLIISASPNVRQRLQINSTHLSVLLNYLPSLFFAYVLLSVSYKNPFNLNVDHLHACRFMGECTIHCWLLKVLG